MLPRLTFAIYTHTFADPRQQSLPGGSVCHHTRRRHQPREHLQREGGGRRRVHVHRPEHHRKVRTRCYRLVCLYTLSGRHVLALAFVVREPVVRIRTARSQRRQIKRDFRFRHSQHVCVPLCKSRSQLDALALVCVFGEEWSNFRPSEAYVPQTWARAAKRKPCFLRWGWRTRSNISTHTHTKFGADTLTAHSIIETCASNKLVSSRRWYMCLCAFEVASRVVENTSGS